MIAEKTFREDLYYRLNGLAVRLPALRERTDLMALVDRILDEQSPTRRLALSTEVIRLFKGYAWPGNIRQLFNVLRTASVMAAGESLITREHLSDDFIEYATRASAEARPATLEAPVAASMPYTPPSSTTLPGSPVSESLVPPAAAGAPARSLLDMEIEAIRAAVAEAGGNISVASKRLGISRNTIYRKLRWRPQGNDQR